MWKTLYLYLLSILPFFADSIRAEEFKTIKGNGYVLTKKIPISEYTEMKIAGNIEKPTFNYYQTESQSSVKITTDSNLFSHIEVKVQKGRLVIETRDKERLQPTRLVVEGQSVRLDKVRIEDSYNFIFQTDLNAENLELMVGGTSEVYSQKLIQVKENCKIKVSDVGKLKVADLQCPHLNAIVTGCGVLDLKGKAPSGKYKVGEAGKLNAYGFVTEELNCHISGSGDAKTHVTEILKGDVSGAGMLKYKGFPRSDIRCTGAGKAKRVK